MFLKPTRKTVRGKTYTNHLLVESISTPNGPRHRTICSLGSLDDAEPRESTREMAVQDLLRLSGSRQIP